MEEIVNRVAKSTLIVLDLEEFYPSNPRKYIDLSQFLEDGILLREKKFRELLKNVDWKEFDNSFVAVYCSTEAIIPSWANLLVASYLSRYAKLTTFGSLEDLEREIWHQIISELDLNKFIDSKIVVKGCSKFFIPTSAYHYLFFRLCKVAASVMYGEACSAVPVFKKTK